MGYFALDAFQMEGQIDQFLVGELLPPGVFHIFRDVSGALVAPGATALDHAPELRVALRGAVLHRLIVEKALGKVTQMDDKTAAIQRFPVKFLLIVILQRVSELQSLRFALDGEADVVGQRDEQRFVQRLRNLLLDVVNQLLRQAQVFERNLGYQLAKLSLPVPAPHTVAFLHLRVVDELAGLSLKAQALAGDDQLVVIVVNDAEDIVIDDPFDAQCPHLPKKQGNQPYPSPAARRRTELVKPKKVTFQLIFCQDDTSCFSRCQANFWATRKFS